jgi:predicted metal-dependent phosphoesterase TrpH
LTPDQLLIEASQAGVELFSITDHDTLEAYRNISISVPKGMQLLVGIELSCTWRRQTIHLVGLNVAPESLSMLEAEQTQGLARAQRFEKIIERLKKAGLQIDSNQLIEAAGSCPGRPHIAKYLVETGQVKSETQAFDRYLGQGKIGDVKECWPDLAKAVAWIKNAGGVAVLAHPIKYGLTRTKLLELATDFKEAGGEAIEVISGKQIRDQTIALSDIAKKFDLLGSVGSDFHKPGQPWASLGRTEPLPRGITPVWSVF